LDRASRLVKIAQTMSAASHLATEEVTEGAMEELPQPVIEAAGEEAAEELAGAGLVDVSEEAPPPEAEIETVGQITFEPDPSTQVEEEKSEETERITKPADPVGAEVPAPVPEVIEEDAESMRATAEPEASP